MQFKLLTLFLTLGLLEFSIEEVQIKTGGSADVDGLEQHLNERLQDVVSHSMEEQLKEKLHTEEELNQVPSAAANKEVIGDKKEPVDVSKWMDDPEFRKRIDGELSKIDVGTLPIHSKKIMDSPTCPGTVEEEVQYHYKTQTDDGEDLDILLPVRYPVDNVISQIYVLPNNPSFNRTYNIYPTLNCKEQDNPELIARIKEMIVPPTGKEYKFRDPIEKNINGEVGQPLEVDSIVFGGELKNGFFLEAGSFEAEDQSDTMHFEIRHNWTGLLVEPNPIAFLSGVNKNRKTQHMNTCLSTKTHPETVNFDPEASLWENGKRMSMGGIVNEKSNKTIPIQCMPLYSLLMAMDNPIINYFSLDIEGAEFPVLKTIPWDKVDIQVLSVETHLAGKLFPGSREELIEYMESVGYRHIPWGHQGTNKVRQALGTIDDMFVRNDIPLKSNENKVQQQSRDWEKERSEL